MVSVFLGSVTHQTDEGFIIRAEELKGLLVFFTDAQFSFCSSSFLKMALLSCQFFCNVGQHPIRNEAGLLDILPALRAEALGSRFSPALGQAGLAEVVATLCGHWILEIVLAEWAGCFVVEILQITLCCHSCQLIHVNAKTFTFTT